MNVAAVATYFPSGHATLEERVAETRRTAELGADEIDMVISRGAFLRGEYGRVFDEVAATKEACGGTQPLDGTPGDACGTCNSGAWACDGDDAVVCDGDLEDDALNRCGGCEILDEIPGDSCGRCGSGRVVCDTEESVQVSEAAMRAENQVPSTLRLRRIEYTIPGHEPSALLTSLLCPKTYAAAEIVALYHERWDLELSYRDIKQTQLQRMESLRSRTPEGVEQEIWGLLTAYQLVRQRMLVVARKLDKAPRRLSFKTTLMAIHAFCIQMTVPLRAPERLSFALEILDATIASGLMPPRRTDRRYARHVKVKMSSYKRNRGRPKNSTGSNSKGNA